jgi:hypothetical protein
MEASDLHEAVKKAEGAMRRRLELAETQRWVHHVADLDSGDVVTTPLDRPVAPLSRAERLSQLGHRINPGVFGGPSQRLSPKQPYQSSPEAWLVYVSGTSYYTPKYDRLWWQPPREFNEEEFPFALQCTFTAPPVGRSVASVSLAGLAFQNTRGFLNFNAIQAEGPPFGNFTIPIDRTFGEQTVDFTFVPPAPPNALDIVITLYPGIEFMEFTAISLAQEPPWVEPGPLID